MKIGIFCSANSQIEPIFFERAAELARWCARQGHSIVFGGCNSGLMGCVAEAFDREVRELKGAACQPSATQPACRGDLIGVVPRIIEQGGRADEHLTVHIPCQDLNDRKELMLAQSDVLVALPGGIGTLDEVFTVAASHTIGYHHKRVILYNVEGFWQPLIGLLDSLQDRGMIRGHWTDYLLTAETLPALAALLTEQ